MSGTGHAPAKPGTGRAAAAIVAIAIGAAGPIIALAEDGGTAEPRRLSFSASAYLWASGLQGTQSLFGLPSTSVDVKFSDIFDKVDMAAAGIVEVRSSGRLGFLGEMNYVKLSADARGPGGVLAGAMDSKAFFALAAGTWRVADEDWGNVDLIGGAKYFRFDNAITLSPGPVSAADAQSWVDATVGAKAAFPISEKWKLLTWAMIGGGGSDMSWDALAALDYRINDKWSASFGYRAMGVDYSSSGFSYDMIQSGPIIGITSRF
ncbi:MAG: hypothetical protein ACKVPY_13040 [Paracoccaceae bacterium]